MNKKYAIIIILTVISIVFAILYFSEIAKQDNTNSSTTINYTVPNNSVISPDNKYLAKHYINPDNGYQSIQLYNIENGVTENITNGLKSDIFHSIIWSEDSKKLYFAKAINSNTDTSFFFMDLDKFRTVTEVVFSAENSELLAGITSIVKEEGGILYLLNGNKIFTLDSNEGIYAGLEQFVEINSN